MAVHAGLFSILSRLSESLSQLPAFEDISQAILKKGR